MAALTLEWSWPAYLAATYVVGATANHSLFLAIHELSHNLGFKSISHNKMLSMVANLPIGIAYCITFKPYHMEHHRYQVRNVPRRVAPRACARLLRAGLPAASIAQQGATQSPHLRCGKTVPHRLQTHCGQRSSGLDSRRQLPAALLSLLCCVWRPWESLCSHQS